jgi:hypothetical protein
LNGYSRSTTPGLPAERIKLLREAHWRMFTDPECQEDIFLKRLECAAGQQRGFGGTGKEVVNQSPEIAAELKRNSRQ